MMIACPKCGRQLNDGTKYCYGCGEPICPTPAPAPTDAPMAQAPAYGAAAPAPALVNKGFPKKALLFGGIGVAAVAVVVLLCVLIFSGGGKKPSYALYIKDQELYFSDLKSEPWQLTSHMVDGKDIDNEALEYYGWRSRWSTCMSENGRYIFFMDKLGSGGALYFKEADPDAEAIKIDSEVGTYFVDSAAEYVAYYKGGNLYRYDIGEDSKEKIAKDVADFGISKDGRRIGYRTTEGDFYLYEDGEKTKILSDTYDLRLVYMDENYTVVYYIKNDALYRYEFDGEKDKIASDVFYAIHVYESGELYFVKRTESEKKEAVSGATSVTDDGGYYVDYSYDSYTERTYSLCYYDGEEITVIAENYDDWEDYAIEQPIVIYSVKDGEDTEQYIAVKGEVSALKADEAERFRIDDAGTVVYYFDDISDDGDEGTLYRIEISGGDIGKPEKFDSDVYTKYCGFVSDDMFLYFKDYDANIGELYINGKKVSDDVYAYSVDAPLKIGIVVFYNDWDKEEESGTLMVYDGDKARKVSDDVYTYTVLPNGHVLYLTDYSAKSHEGNLYDWYDGDAERIDDDVAYLVPYYDSPRETGY